MIILYLKPKKHSHKPPEIEMVSISPSLTSSITSNSERNKNLKKKKINKQYLEQWNPIQIHRLHIIFYARWYLIKNVNQPTNKIKFCRTVSVKLSTTRARLKKNATCVGETSREGGGGGKDSSGESRKFQLILDSAFSSKRRKFSIVGLILNLQIQKQRKRRIKLFETVSWPNKLLPPFWDNP